MYKRKPLSSSFGANSSQHSQWVSTPHGRTLVVDLTNSDDEDNPPRPSKARRLNDSEARPAHHAPGGGRTPITHRVEEWDWSDHEEERAFELFDIGLRTTGLDTVEQYGTLQTRVVGMRFYRGCASCDEVVLLQREPRNQYDRNAIRVNNVSQEQIGHLPRQIAAKLAEYMDSNALLLEAKLSDQPGHYECDLEIQLYGPRDPILQERMKARLVRSGLPIDTLRQRDKQEKAREKARSKAERKREARMEASMGASTRADMRANMGPGMGARPGANMSPGIGSSMGARPGAGVGPGMESSYHQWKSDLQSQLTASNNAVLTISDDDEDLDDLMDFSERFNPREAGEVVEKYGMDENALKNMPLAEPPQRLATTLLPYQKQGLAWMLRKEHPVLPAVGSDETCQLWRRAGEYKWTHIATNFSIVNQTPKIARGGILADDMGLGKTLEVISLILANPSPKQGVSNSECHATLIVAPLSVMSNWRSQFEQHVRKDERLRVLTYHGPKRGTLTSTDFCQYDIVITTYGVLATEFNPSEGARQAKSGLFSTTWHRIVLDEGHTIRNPGTQSSLAATALKGTNRWALSGTPIINNLKDLYSLVRFIGLTGGLEQLQIFSRLLNRPPKTRDAGATRLLQTLMSSLCLRRRKDMAFIDLRLPELTEYIHRIEFTASEKEKYEALNQEAKGLLRTVEEYGEQPSEGRGVQETYRHLFEVLLRLRQVCNHWRLCEARVSALMSTLEGQQTVERTAENEKALQDVLRLAIESREECPVCMDDLTGHDPVITTCAHVFGRDCITRVIETQHKCPMCRAPLPDTHELVAPAAELGEDNNNSSARLTGTDGEEDEGSSKITALLSILRASHKQRGTKVVVFSQWTKFLDLVQPHLDAAGYTYARLDGSMAVRAREAALDALEQDPRTTILLASLNVCSVGLNLTAASTVVLCDSWWAPAIEDQAVDRVHRLGQTKPCTVWRLVMAPSVEERVLLVQDDKRRLMARAFQERETLRKGRAGRLGDIQRLLA